MNVAIEDFLYWDSWFSAYKLKPGGRYYTFKAALNLFLQNNGNLIVETGCVREPEDWGAGYSTYIFGQVAQRYNKQVITIDNVPEHLDMCKNITKDFKDHIQYVFSDSIQFLSTFTRPIDLLYLDSMDCPLDETANALPAQKHALKELLAWKVLPTFQILPTAPEEDRVNITILKLLVKEAKP